MQDISCEKCKPLIYWIQEVKMEQEKKTIIQDWAGNVCFHGIKFKDFDDAEEFLATALYLTYEEDRQEYFITEEEVE